MADLGRAYESLDRPAEAEATYQRALSIDADYADVRGRLATLMLMRGAVDEARRHAEMALRVQPNRQALRELHQKASRAAPDRQP